LIAAGALLTTLLADSELLIFIAFLTFEAAIGVYFPSMGSLKGRMIEDGMRGKVYGLLRLPLNLFVVVGHSLAEDGDRHRGNVFLTCSGLLLVAFWVQQRYLVGV
jgi:hypothetical protein